MGPISIIGLGAFIMAGACRLRTPEWTLSGGLATPWLLYWLLGLGACGLDQLIHNAVPIH